MPSCPFCSSAGDRALGGASVFEKFHPRVGIEKNHKSNLQTLMDEAGGRGSAFGQTLRGVDLQRCAPARCQ